MAAAGQRLPVRRALAARAGQVVQGDGGLQVEQVGGALEEMRLDRVAVAQQAVAGAVRGVPAHGLAVAAEQLAQGAALGLVLDRGGAGPELEGALGGGEDALDAGAQRRPAPARQGDVAAEVEQGALAHPGAAADEALGEVGLLALGAGAGGGPADEQAPMGAGPGTGVKELQVAVALHLGFRRLAIENQRLAVKNTPNSAKIAPRLANLG